MNQQVREPEWAPETDEGNESMRRAWSIEDLRNRLGVTAPEARETPRKSEVAMGPPRIIRRGMAPALA